MDSRNEFIREITLRICSSLDIKESLCRAFEYLREHFPLDVLTLFIIDERLGAIRRIAHVYENGAAVPPDEIIPLPAGIPEKIAARNFSEPFIVDAGEDELFRILAPLAKAEGNTDLIVPLRMQGNLLGGLTLRAGGEGRYTDEQAQLLGCIAKPFAIALANALAHEEVLRYQAVLLDDKRFLSRELHGSADEIIGGNTGLRNVMEMVHQVAPLNNTVLLLGETGTGKELIANAIHFSSPRKNSPLVKVNCGALPENLIDSELFGHERGAFTGAVATKKGRFELADSGTLFLDEIGELSPNLQVKLLRVLQEKMFERVGGIKPISVDIRIIAATNKKLKQEVINGHFREDLFFRLNVVHIELPPLRERPEDIRPLINHFIEKFANEHPAETPIKGIDRDAERLFYEYSWPGNIRELENVIERAMILCPADLIRISDLPNDFRKRTYDVLHLDGIPPDAKLNETLDMIEKKMVERALKLANNVQSQAAELLGIGKSGLNWKIKKFNMDVTPKS